MSISNLVLSKRQLNKLSNDTKLIKIKLVLKI